MENVRRRRQRDRSELISVVVQRLRPAGRRLGVEPIPERTDEVEELVRVRMRELGTKRGQVGALDVRLVLISSDVQYDMEYLSDPRVRRQLLVR